LLLVPAGGGAHCLAAVGCWAPADGCGWATFAIVVSDNNTRVNPARGAHLRNLDLRRAAISALGQQDAPGTSESTRA
jgi:hypothetical protein